jgi:hypothetical protein
LYLVLGRPDLAAEYDRRRFTRRALKTAGGVVAGLGFAWAGVSYFSYHLAERGHTGSETRRYERDTLVGLSAGVLGVASFVAGIVLDVQPIDAADAASLVRDYNDGLRQQLGLAQ